MAQLSQFPSGNDVLKQQSVSPAAPLNVTAQPETKAVPAQSAPLSAPSPAPSVASDPPAEPLPQWEELLREMERDDPALFSMLDGSTAAKSGKTVIISSSNQMLKGMLLTNNIGARLADLVEQKLGSRHKLRIAKKAPVAVTEKQSPAFADILSRAAGEGVEIRLQK